MNFKFLGIAILVLVACLAETQPANRRPTQRRRAANHLLNPSQPPLTERRLPRQDRRRQPKSCRASNRRPTAVPAPTPAADGKHKNPRLVQHRVRCHLLLLAIRIRDRPVSVAKAGTVSIDEVRTIPVDFGDYPQLPCRHRHSNPRLTQRRSHLKRLQPSPKSSSSKTASNSNPSASAATLRHSNQKVSPEPSAPKSPKEPQSNGSQHSKQTPRPTTSSPSKKPIYTSEGTTLTSPSTTETPDPVGNENGGPYPFGDSHSRSPGFGGEGWTVQHRRSAHHPGRLRRYPQLPCRHRHSNPRLTQPTVSPQAASASPKSSSSKTASNSNPSASAATLRHSNQKVSPEPSAPKSPKEPQSMVRNIRSKRRDLRHRRHRRNHLHVRGHNTHFTKHHRNAGPRRQRERRTISIWRFAFAIARFRWRRLDRQHRRSAHHPGRLRRYPQLPCRHRHSNPRLTQRRSHLKRLQLPRSRPHPKRHRTRILQHQLRLFVTRIRRSHPSRRRRNHPRNHNQMVRNIRSKRRDLRHRRHRRNHLHGWLILPAKRERRCPMGGRPIAMALSIAAVVVGVQHQSSDTP